jgi:hypothetical protein
MEWKLGLLMDLPEGKRAGFYAQIVKALAGSVELFDRDKELLIVNTAEDAAKVETVLHKYHVTWESMRLVLLPEDTKRYTLAEDYGFQSKFGKSYLYADRIAAFTFTPEQPAEAEPASALLQMEEFFIAVYQQHDGSKTYFVENHLQETIEGIALRYHSTVTFLPQAD